MVLILWFSSLHPLPTSGMAICRLVSYPYPHSAVYINYFSCCLFEYALMLIIVFTTCRLVVRTIPCRYGTLQVKKGSGLWEPLSTEEPIFVCWPLPSMTEGALTTSRPGNMSSCIMLISKKELLFLLLFSETKLTCQIGKLKRTWQKLGVFTTEMHRTLKPVRRIPQM